MEEKRKYYKFLDIARIYCAVQVVVIHMGFGNSFPIIPCLARQAVPFFFLASGFFFLKMMKNKDVVYRTRQYVRSLLSIYIVWITIWSPYLIAEYRKLYPNSPIKMILVLLRRFLFAGIAPYWYLLVLAESAVFMAYIIKNNIWKTGSVLCAIGILLCCLYGIQTTSGNHGVVYKVFYTVFSWDCNVVMMGFPLMYLGALLERHEKKIRELCSFYPMLILYGSSVAIIFLVYNVNKNIVIALPYGMIEGILLLMVCICQNPFEEKIQKAACKGARDLSAVIFFTHTIILSILGHGLGIWNHSVLYSLTLFVAFLLYLVIGKINNRPLKWLFMIK